VNTIVVEVFEDEVEAGKEDADACAYLQRVSSVLTQVCAVPSTEMESASLVISPGFVLQVTTPYDETEAVLAQMDEPFDAKISTVELRPTPGTVTVSRDPPMDPAFGETLTYFGVTFQF